MAFNVYLESPRAFEDYLARIHSLSDDRPVLLSEIGLDSLRNGEGSQAAMLDWQVRAALRLGCSGVIVFAWTDEWYHGKYPVEDWAFGLTTRDRTPKPALETVTRAFAESPFPSDKRWPRDSLLKLRGFNFNLDFLGIMVIVKQIFIATKKSVDLVLDQIGLIVLPAV